jgi:transposase
MPRTPLAEISTNHVRNTELSPYLRGAIDFAAKTGLSQRQIADTLNLTRTTVQYTLNNDSHRFDGKSTQRPGRPKKYSSVNTRNIIRFVRIHLKSTYEDIRQNLHIYLSHDTFSRILDSAGIKNWRAKARPILKPEYIRIRYN